MLSVVTAFAVFALGTTGPNAGARFEAVANGSRAWPVPDRAFRIASGYSTDEALVDMDGDRRPDQVYCLAGENENRVLVARNTGERFLEPVDWLLPPDFRGNFCRTANVIDNYPGVRSFDGDGRPDAMEVIVTGSGKALRVHLNLGNRFHARPHVVPIPTELVSTARDHPFDGLRVLDLDGDGDADLVSTHDVATGKVRGHGTEPYWLVALGNGRGFGSVSRWSVPLGGRVDSGFNGLSSLAGEYPHKFTVGDQSWRLQDVTGDGRPDLIVAAERTEEGSRFPGSTKPHWRVFPGGANGFEKAIELELPSAERPRDFYFAGWPGRGTVLIDVDGDRSLELVSAAPFPAEGVGVWKVYGRTERGWTGKPAYWQIRNAAELGWGVVPSGYALKVCQRNDPTCEERWSIWHIVDLTGDGKVELVTWEVEPGVNAPGAPASPHFRAYHFEQSHGAASGRDSGSE